jgi:hypothetical protein
MTMRQLVLATLLATLACMAPPDEQREDQLPAPEPVAVDYPVEPAPELPTLEPGREYEVELLGELFLDPFGYSGRFVMPNGEQLLLLWARPQLLVHHGRRVRARGRLWDCAGERVFAPTELELLAGQSAQLEAELPLPPRVRSARQVEELRSPWFRVVAEVWLVVSNRAWLRLEDGTMLIVDTREFVEPELRAGERMSLTLERHEPHEPFVMPRVVAGCLGDRDRCGPAPELGHASRFSASECVRVQGFGGSRLSKPFPGSMGPD